MKKGFTLVEVTVAVGLLVMMLFFSSLIFKVSIGSQRLAGANAEIMQKFRAITDQLNTDFEGLQKDGHLRLRSGVVDRPEYEHRPGYKRYVDPAFNPAKYFRVDKLYYFSTGDFQSRFAPYPRSNVARIFLSHDNSSLNDRPVCKWRLAHAVRLLTPGLTPTPPATSLPVDCDNISYAKCKNDLVANYEDPGPLFQSSIVITVNPADNIRSLMAENVGQMIIQWTDGTIVPGSPFTNASGSLMWYGLSVPNAATNAMSIAWSMPPSGNSVISEGGGVDPPYYNASWGPNDPEELWPKALKFTFTLYDSDGVIKGGRTFTHIVYIGD